MQVGWRWASLWLTAAFAACSNGQVVPPQALPAPSAASLGLGARERGTTYHGCPIFGSSGPYNKLVAGARVDSRSGAYIASVLQAGDIVGFFGSTGIEQVNLADDQTPLLRVLQKSPYHPFPVPYPWQRGFFIEPLADHHAMVVQTQTCHLYEAYSTTYRHGKLSAYSGANWDLRRRFVSLDRGQPSAMASGLSLFAGMVRWEDYQSGSIAHALNWAAVAHTVSQYNFVAPASDTDGLPFRGASRYQLPYGARLRLKASFDTSGWGPQATMVATAMKTYGIYLADTDSRDNAIYFANAPDGSDPWNRSDLRSLSAIHISDFDVLELPRVQHVDH